MRPQEFVKDENAIWIEVTPGMAQELLRTQDLNRNIRHHHAHAMARDMLAGRYDGRVSNILLDKEGILLDGQHRMLAVTIAQIPIFMRIIMDVPREAVEKVDSGKPRTFSDRLKMRGEKHTMVMSSTYRLLENYKRKIQKVVLSSQEEMQLYEKHPGIRDSVARVIRVSKLFSPPPVALVDYLIGLSSPGIGERLADFVNTIVDGVPANGHLRFGPDDPAHRCREWMINYVTASRAKRAQPNSLVLLKALIRSWNGYVVGRTLKKFPSPIEAEIEDLVGVNVNRL